MSAIRCVSVRVNRHTSPPAPILTITLFGTFCPAAKFRFDANGRGSPHGHTVTNPAPPGSVTVTFSTAAAASTGTPARPATDNSVVEPAGRTPNPAPAPSTVTLPGRLSNNRAGLIGVYDAPAGKKPLRSAIRCV